MFFEGRFGYRNGPFQIFSAMAHGFPYITHVMGHVMASHESWMAGHGVTTME